MKKKVLHVLLCCIITSLLAGCDNGNLESIDADDNGAGKIIKLPVTLPRDGSQTMTDDNGNPVLRWLDTGLIVNGQYYDAYGNIIPAIIGLSVKNFWYPWGRAAQSFSGPCVITTCGQSNDYRCAILNDPSMPITQNDSINDGCYLANGLGIYILVAQRRSDNSYPDPNATANIAAGPSASDGFFTGHIGAFTPANDGTINIDKLWSCDQGTGTLVCDAVPLSNLAGGKIYLKVFDGFYSDNDADFSDVEGNKYVTINVKSGIYYPNFISATLTTIDGTLKQVTMSLENAILNSMRQIVFLVVLLYFTFTSLFFLIGVTNLTQTEAVVRLLKMGIVIMLTSPNNLIAEGFLNIYESIATFASNIIASNLRGMPSPSTASSSDFGNQIGYLVIYDGILNQAISSQVNIKIWSLLFTSHIWCIPLLYILLVIIIVVVLRALLLYITAYFQISILILIMPIFAVMVLFNVTANLFQNWLKYMANSALLIIVATLGMGLSLGMMNQVLSDLLKYSVSKQNIWWFIFWWRPDNEAVLSAQLNAGTYFTALIIALICYAFVEHVPKLADALSDAQLSPSTQAFSALWNSTSELFNNGLSGLKKINAKYLVGRALDQRYKTDGKYDEKKEGKGILDKWKMTRASADAFFYKHLGSKYDRLFGEDGAPIFVDPVAEKIKQKEMALLDAKNKYTINDYQSMIDDRRTKLLEQISSNDRFKDTINVQGVGDISLKADTNPNVNINGNPVLKQDIRDAVAGNGQLNIGGVNYNVRSLYDQQQGDKLNRKLEELGNIQKELKRVKRME